MMIKAIAGNKILKIPRKKLKKKKSISLKLGKDHYLILSQVKVLVAQSCPTLCNPMDCGPPGYTVHGFSRQEYWNGFPFPSPGDLPNPGIELGSPRLQADSLPSEPPNPITKKTPCCDFPGGPVAKTLQPQRRGLEFDPWSQN